MPAVFRLKRKRNSEIADAFYISCKKSRTDEIESDHTLFKYGGSTDFAIAENLFSHVKDPFDQNTSPNKAESKLKRKYQTLGEKNIINVKKSFVDDELHVYDIEDSQSSEKDIKLSGITCNGLNMLKTQNETPLNEEDFVYDIYFTNNKLFDVDLAEEELVIEKQKEIFFLDDYRNNLESDSESEDSNAEDNWRNDYPDEDPHYYDCDVRDNSDENSYYDCDDDIEYKELSLSKQLIKQCELNDDSLYD